MLRVVWDVEGTVLKGYWRFVAYVVSFHYVCSGGECGVLDNYGRLDLDLLNRFIVFKAANFADFQVFN